jgi:hypothetical protein
MERDIMLLADTPPTIIPFLFITFCGFASPFVLLLLIVLACRAATRQLALRTFGAGIAGAILFLGSCALIRHTAGDTSGMPLSLTYTIATADGFGLFSLAALAVFIFRRYARQKV